MAENRRGLRFDYLLPHLEEDFKIYLSQDRKNILKCFDLTEGAADAFADLLIKDVTKNRIKAPKKLSIFKRIIFKMI